jgi:hypothetical protein
MIKLLSKVCGFCEEQGHVIMDCPFVPFTSKQVLLSMWSYKCGKSINGSTTRTRIRNFCNPK